jgi:hypothetical protein
MSVSEASRIHSYQLKDVQSQNSTDHLICYIPPIQDAFTESTEKAVNLLHPQAHSDINAFPDQLR